MKIHGLPEKVWVVMEPSPGSTTDDICFACTLERLLQKVRGGLQEDGISGIFADETEARKATAKLLGQFPVRPMDTLALEVTVHVMVIPSHEEMTAGDLARAAVEAVWNAVRQAEVAGFLYGLHEQVSLGAGTVELRNQSLLIGS